MSEVILKICVSVVIFEIIKIISPTGRLSGFTDAVYSVILLIMVFNVISGFDGIELPELSLADTTEYRDTYENDVYDEYRRKVTALIEEKCGVCPEVSFDGYTITNVVFDAEPGFSAVNYLINELGVERNAIVIRKNQ